MTLDSNTSRALVIGQKIVDFYFCYYDNEIDFDFSAFIKLSNNYYLSEKNFGPVGITNVNLIIFNEKQFMNQIDRLKKVNIDVNSFSNQQ